MATFDTTNTTSRPGGSRRRGEGGRPRSTGRRHRDRSGSTSQNSTDQLDPTVEAIIGQCANTVFGQDRVIKLMLASMLAGGHVLLEAQPGTAKTLLIKELGGAFNNATWGRIQFTPDHVASDITGYVDHTGQFLPGPVFVNFVLADEINRTQPKTLSGLLEAMAEGHVTIPGIDPQNVAELFMVLATMNPIENEGTYVLPEALVDRFFVRTAMQPMERAHTVQMLSTGNSSTTPQGNVEIADILALKHEVQTAPFDGVLAEWMHSVMEGSHRHQHLQLGLSPRSLVQWRDVAKGWAKVTRNSVNVTHGDLLEIGEAALLHRLIPADAHYDTDLQEVLSELLHANTPTTTS